MIYTVDISTPANTAKVDKQHTPLFVTKGLVYQVEIDFPYGSAGLLHLIVEEAGVQIWPTNEQATFHTPGFVISFPDTRLKEIPPYHYDVFTWNLDDTLDHACQVRVGLVSKEAFMARFMPSMVYQDMLDTLEAMKNQQEQERLAIINNPFDRVVTGESD